MPAKYIKKKRSPAAVESPPWTAWSTPFEEASPVTRQIAPGDKCGDAVAAASNIHRGKGGAGGAMCHCGTDGTGTGTGEKGNFSHS
jgi:hypothetical protein